MAEPKTLAQRLRAGSTLLALLLAVGACSATATAPAAKPAVSAPAGRSPCGAPRPDPLRLEPVGQGHALPSRRPPTRDDPLRPLHDALAQLEAGRPAEPVSILVLGDSHIAGQYFAGRLREVLQARFGSAGPGGMPARAARRGYRNPLAEVEQTGAWTGVDSLRPTTPGPFGISLYRLRGETPAAMAAHAVEPAGFDRLTATLVRQPGAGALRVTVDGCPLGTVAAAGDEGAVRLVADLPPGARDVTMETAGGAVELLGWRLTRPRGVLVENHGVNGARLSMLARLDPDIVAAELRERDPALIIVAFGTNEAFSTDLTEAGYRAIVAERLAALRRAAPRAAILIVGPPDSAVRIRPARPRGPGAKRRAAGCRWKAPPNLAMVKTVLRQAAADLGVAYWDWSQWTGGPCGVDAMTRHDPPLAQPDHVHFTAAGYARAAEQLSRFLTDGYVRRRRTS